MEQEVLLKLITRLNEDILTLKIEIAKKDCQIEKFERELEGIRNELESKQIPTDKQPTGTDINDSHY